MMITIKLETGSPRLINYQSNSNLIFQPILLNWQPGISYEVWRPPTDLYETENDLIVRVEIAGVNEKDFVVTIDHNILLISGVRTDKREHRAFHQIEIPFGDFSVQVEIPGDIDIEKAHAEYQNGLLYVIMPKIEPKPIHIKTDTSQ